MPILLQFEGGFLHSHPHKPRVLPVGLKAYVGILHSLALTDVNLCARLLIYLFSLADSMLGKLNKKDLAARAKKIR